VEGRDFVESVSDAESQFGEEFITVCGPVAILGLNGESGLEFIIGAGGIGYLLILGCAGDDAACREIVGDLVTESRDRSQGKGQHYESAAWVQWGQTQLIL
jgi:hypothetical protein